MDDETHVAIDLAIEADAELLREALKTLKIETARAHRWDNSGDCYGQRPSCPSVHCAEARISITKLEERLLRE